MVKNVNIQGHEVVLKEYDGKRVVTFKDIDKVHERPNGTARRNFNDNRKHFVEGKDFFKISMNEFRTLGIEDDYNYPKGVIFITESGYLMLVKSFTDDLAWKVQRDLVNNYFRGKEVVKEIMDFVNSATESNADTPQRGITRDDYIRAATIVGSCRNERLPVVMKLLERAGLEMPRLADLQDEIAEKADRDITGETARAINDAINDYGFTLRRIERLTGVSAMELSRIRKGVSNPKKARMRIIINAIRSEIEKIDNE